MPTFLSDPTPAVYAVLAVFAAIAAGLWVRNRDRRSLVVAAAGVGLFALLFLCDRLVESPREEAVRKVQEMVAAVNERNADKFMAHLSASFAFKSLQKADGARQVVAAAKQYNVRVAVWDFNRDEVKYDPAGGPSVEVAFAAKAEGPGGEPYMVYLKAVFVRDPDGQYRMRSFAPYNYINRTAAEHIPGL